MKRVLLFDRVKDDHIKNWLQGLIKYFENKNFQVDTSHGTHYNFHIDYDLICIWNGQLDIYQPLIDHAKKNNIKLLYLECGFFPQSRYYYVDRCGINAQASIMEDNLDWISDEHYIKLDEFRTKYLDGKKWNSPGRYILCPLQIPSDTNVLKNSPYKNLQDLINHVEENFPNDLIVFKNHPLLPNINYRVSGNNALIRQGNFLEIVQDAKLVYGMTSTSLLESSLMGVPTEAIGNCWLSKHKQFPEKLLAALIEKQIPVGEVELDRWMEEYI